jgi:hypothetical protein
LYKPIYIGIGLASFLGITRYELPRPKTKASKELTTPQRLAIGTFWKLLNMTFPKSRRQCLK